jgi:hypothetical protein
VKWRLFGIAAATAVALAPAAQGSFRPATTAPPPVVTIKVMITDSKIGMSPKRAQRGVMARFILINRGVKPHTFKLGHERHGTGTQTGFTKALKPREQSILIFFLDYRGKLPYLGSLPADRSKPGMRGTFTIF